MVTAEKVTTKPAHARNNSDHSDSYDSAEVDPAIKEAVLQTIDDNALESIVRKMLSSTVELAATFELKYDREVERNQVSFDCDDDHRFI